MAETIDELTYNYEEDGRLVRKELQREVLSKGAWSTIMFLFQELDRQKDEWRAPKIAIVRYKKWNGVYRKQSGFNISSEKQARAIVGAIENWYAADGAAADSDGAAGAGAGAKENTKAKVSAESDTSAKSAAKTVVVTTSESEASSD